MAPHDQLPVLNHYCTKYGDVNNIILLSRGTTVCLYLTSRSRSQYDLRELVFIFLPRSFGCKGHLIVFNYDFLWSKLVCFV